MAATDPRRRISRGTLQIPRERGKRRRMVIEYDPAVGVVVDGLHSGAIKLKHHARIQIGEGRQAWALLRVEDFLVGFDKHKQAEAGRAAKREQRRAEAVQRVRAEVAGICDEIMLGSESEALKRMREFEKKEFKL